MKTRTISALSLVTHLTLALVWLMASPAVAQEPPPVYQSQSGPGLRFDGVIRQEWDQDFFVSPTETRDDSRRRFQIRPRLDFGQGAIQLGVGGELNYSSDKNTEPPPRLIRDNYKSRDVRLDLAYLRLQPVRWLHLEGGRFIMPVAFTEMIWDRDLRPQGGAVTLRIGSAGSARFSATALVARGSHVFDDDDTNMVVFSGQLEMPTSPYSTFELVGSFIRFTDFATMEGMIRRQNTRDANGDFLRQYDVVDLVGRLRSEGNFHSELVANFSWNTAEEEDNKGLWLALRLGSLNTARGVLEYSYAKVDRDATLAAYGTDDFLWVTGWEGHRVDLGARSTPKSSFHVVGQLQRFKDAPLPEARDHWVKRLRIEVRMHY